MCNCEDRCHRFLQISKVWKLLEIDACFDSRYSWDHQMKMDPTRYTWQRGTELGSDPRSPDPEPGLFDYIMPIQLDSLQHASRACQGQDTLMGITHTAHTLGSFRKSSCFMLNAKWHFIVSLKFLSLIITTDLPVCYSWKLSPWYFIHIWSSLPLLASLLTSIDA